MRTRDNFRAIAFASALAATLAPLGCAPVKPAAEAGESAPDSILHISPGGLSATELTIAPLREEMLADTLTLTGQIEAKPLSIAHVSTRTAGTVEAVLAVIGDHVRRGQVLARLFSPEFSAAESDYLLAHERVESSAVSDSQFRSVALSARQRLELLGASREDIEQLERGHEAMPFLPLRSPIDGVMNEVEAAAGRHVEAGTDLFGIVDLREVWAVVHAYERDLGRLRTGQAARLTTTAFGESEFRGRIVSLEGVIDEATRTLGVRLAVANPELRLRPGMFVSARVATGVQRPALVVDGTAIQSQDGSSVVYVALTDSTFVVRPVTPRALGGNRAELVSGVRAGERIAVRGAFLLKSQAAKGQLGEE